ncbi:50S ribosomal protein L17 [Candidatus Nomurabacteria bacterium]|nr:50S ribosomal protein L17 [Candidatus Nomurabacteria bacterium]
MPGTRKLGRTTEHRMSMLKGMVTFLLENGKIETTITRAKELSALADKIITLGKDNTLASKRRAFAFLKKEEVVYKLFDQIAPFYQERIGGYTAVYKLGPRRGDGAEMALVTLVEADDLYKKDNKDSKKGDKKEAKKEAKKAAKAE